jgi:hypothetical protein
MMDALATSAIAFDAFPSLRFAQASTLIPTVLLCLLMTSSRFRWRDPSARHENRLGRTVTSTQA